MTTLSNEGTSISSAAMLSKTIRERADGPLIYFDTNVYDHIEKCLGIDHMELDGLREHFRSLATLLLSVHNLEEAVQIGPRSGDHARRLLTLMLDLSSGDELFREPRDLMTSALRAALDGGTVPSAFESDSRDLLAVAAALVRPGDAADREILDVANETSVQAKVFADGMVEARQLTAEHLRPLNRAGRQIPFEEYFPRARQIFARYSLERVATSVTETQVDALLALPYPRAYCDASASLVYAYNFEDLHPRPSDSRDLFHAALAGFVDTFVVNDRRLVRLLARIPERTYEVTDLRGFLDALPRPSAPSVGGHD